MSTKMDSTPSGSTETTVDSKDELIKVRLLQLAVEKGGTLSNDDIKVAFAETSAQLRVSAVNKLLQEGTFEVFTRGSQLVYRLKDPNKKSQPPKGSDTEEKVVYSIIEDGGNKGIWIRDIRAKSNLLMTQLNKILKNLEKEKLIKAVKSVNSTRKKVYMLYHLDPDRSVTGGAWYQDRDFEVEFVDVLNQQCLRFLRLKKEEADKGTDGPLFARQRATCTVQEVHKFISDLGISKIKLDDEDLQTILRTVVYDGNAESELQSDGSVVYRAVNAPLPSTGLVQTPCGICPVIKNCCASNGSVTPMSCSYLTEWLE